jgi:hypothetical protein
MSSRIWLILFSEGVKTYARAQKCSAVAADFDIEFGHFTLVESYYPMVGLRDVRMILPQDSFAHPVDSYVYFRSADLH